MGQSTNDVFPTATRLAMLAMLPDARRRGARARRDARAPSADEFAGVLKTGRTHLQDAVPITLGQEFGGYAANIASRSRRSRTHRDAAARAEPRRDGGRHRAQCRRRLHRRARSRIWRHDTGLPLRPASDRFRVTQSMGDVLAYSGALRRLAVESRQGRLGPAAPQHGAARGHRRDPAARRCSRGRRSCLAR